MEEEGTLRQLWRGFTIQREVVAALLQFQFVARWGRKNLGFAWLFCESLVFAFPVLAVWHFVRDPYEHGLPMTAFVWSGYMPLLIFRHVTGQALHTITGAVPLLYHRRITPFDLYLGHQGLEAIGNLSAVAFSFIVFYILGLIDLPYNYNILLLGFIYTTWWSMCIGLIVTALASRSEIVHHIWLPISYLYVFFCGFMFMAAWLPFKLREIALMIDPPLQCYEMIRAGLFGNQVQTFYDLSYITFILLTLTFVGLWLIQNVRKHLEL